jgi:hypothetical protein
MYSENCQHTQTDRRAKVPIHKVLLKSENTTYNENWDCHHKQTDNTAKTLSNHKVLQKLKCTILYYEEERKNSQITKFCWSQNGQFYACKKKITASKSQSFVEIRTHNLLVKIATVTTHKRTIHRTLHWASGETCTLWVSLLSLQTNELSLESREPGRTSVATREAGGWHRAHASPVKSVMRKTGGTTGAVCRSRGYTELERDCWKTRANFFIHRHARK